MPKAVTTMVVDQDLLDSHNEEFEQYLNRQLLDQFDQFGVVVGTPRIEKSEHCDCEKYFLYDPGKHAHIRAIAMVEPGC